MGIRCYIMSPPALSLHQHAICWSGVMHVRTSDKHIHWHFAVLKRQACRQNMSMLTIVCACRSMTSLDEVQKAAQAFRDHAMAETEKDLLQADDATAVVPAASIANGQKPSAGYAARCASSFCSSYRMLTRGS